ncbi:hypothetical protein FPFC_030740 [Fructobacillus pseudoficulneus]|uniref:Type IV methyl-directed restriction enzyme EcoKMcrB subunit DNA-binding domain-containing protein n=1 Tax=Fructobacillus pseudoficulneus TaxID=220714 RepID=A0A3F3GVK2_9LACO|nr:DUF3578 domain-containing protein [Fructobacillus pseudoficulneus]GAP02894.1 hypothetical protein FPFC_030740 [Fructobacillus pseudoficulneus]SEH45375.1 protein of unknown function [Fructobacillus pseudoficulneus]
MTIRNTIETVLNEYLDEKSQPIKNNALAKLLRNGFSEDAEGLFTENIVSFGSAGKGNWATAPWIGVFDTDITRSAVRGFYIVYLFSSDMSRVYLSLNQGWTFFS